MAPSQDRIVLNRAPNLLAQEVGDEIVVVDSTTQQAHALSGLVADLWRASATGEWTGAVTPEVEAAYAELASNGIFLAERGMSRRRMLQGVGAAAAIGGLATIALPAADAAASGITGSPLISLSPVSGPRGTVVTVAGSNFYPSGTISTVTIGGVTVTPSTTTISSTGTISFTFVVPVGAATGGDTVAVTDNHSNTATATFTVSAQNAASVTLSTTAFPKATGTGNGTGTTHATASSGFAPNSPLTVTVTGGFQTASITAGPTSTTSSGTISTSTIVTVTYSNGANQVGTIVFTDSFGNTASVPVTAG
jgi:hypothetical protein